VNAFAKGGGSSLLNDTFTLIGLKLKYRSSLQSVWMNLSMHT
jgi:hypothetical protein